MPIESTIQTFNLMRAKNLEIKAIHLLSPADINPLNYGRDTGITAVDSETGEEVDLSLSDSFLRDYEFYLAEHTTRLRTYFAENGISYVFTPSTTDLSDFVVKNLATTGLLR